MSSGLTAILQDPPRVFCLKAKALTFFSLTLTLPLLLVQLIYSQMSTENLPSERFLRPTL